MPRALNNYVEIGPVDFLSAKVVFGQRLATCTIRDNDGIVRVADLQILDDGAGGFATVGAWSTNATSGRDNDVRYSAAGAGANEARWTFPVVPGVYRVSATWTRDANRATHAPYSVWDGSEQVALVTVNQRQPANDRVDAGSSWKDLGTLHLIRGDTLTVKLNNLADGYVIADAVRIEWIPEVTIVDDGAAGFATAGSWTVNTSSGQDADLRYSAKGSGGNEARWTFPVVPGVYRVSATWLRAANRATNAPYSIWDESRQVATMAVNQQQPANDRIDAGSGWKDLGVLHAIRGNTLTVKLHNLADGYVIADAVRIERIADIQVLDDGAAGFTMAGTWTVNSSIGRDGDLRYSAKGSGSNEARWTFPVAPGAYRVSVNWLRAANRATNAQYTIWDGSRQVAAVAINQQQPAGDRVDAGSSWEDLGTFHVVSGNTLTVKLSNLANGYVIADGVRTERIADVRILDDGAAGFTTVGSWKVNSSGGRDGDLRYSAAGTGSNQAVWTFHVAPGVYRVSTTWTAGNNRATNARYSVWDGSQQVATTAVNQKLAPEQRFDAGTWWRDLGTQHAITGGTLTVKLTNLADGYVIADAVRIERIADL